MPGSGVDSECPHSSPVRARRMETTGLPNRVHISQATRDHLLMASSHCQAREAAGSAHVGASLRPGRMNSIAEARSVEIKGQCFLMHSFVSR